MSEPHHGDPERPLCPLREGAAADATLVRAAAVVASARPIEPSTARMQRAADGVRLRAHHRGRLILRPAIALGVLVVASAAAAAVSWWVTRTPVPAAPRALDVQRVPATPPPIDDAATRAQRTQPMAAVAPILSAPNLARVFVVPAAPPPVGEADDGDDLAPASRGVEARAPAAPSTPASAVVAAQPAAEPTVSDVDGVEGEDRDATTNEAESAASTEAPAPEVVPARANTAGFEGSDEASLMMFATSKLRRDRDPRQTLELLRYARARFPAGALGQEHLALEIEARMALGDPRAAALAERYLARHPQGPFRATAQRALRRFGR